VLYFISSFVLFFVLIMKAKAIKKKFNDFGRSMTALCASVVVSTLVWFFLVPRIKLEFETADQEKLGTSEAKNDTVEEQPDFGSQETSDIGQINLEDAENDKQVAKTDEKDDDKDVDPEEPELTERKTDLKSMLKMFSEKGYTDEESRAVYVFKYLVVYMACLESIAHGSNDTANATGAFSSVFQSYDGGLTACDKSDSQVWILAVAGFFVFLGITTYGYNVIQTIGTNITNIDFHRGFFIEFGSTTAILVATYLEMPVSTTHCQIGAVVFVGAYASGMDKVDWKLFGTIAASWVATLPIAGGGAAIITAILKAAWS